MVDEPKLDGWNHRLMHHKKRNPLHDKNPKIPEYSEWYAIHEVYYDKDGNPVSWTKEAINVLAESPEDVRWTLEKMLAALEKPTLEYGDEDSPTDSVDAAV